MNNKVIIIGSGFSSLSSACYLSKRGYQVEVFEKNESLGGRARQFKKDGFTFDMGPSWYWMPDVIEKFYNHFGHTASDFYELVKLDPGFKVIFGENECIDIPENFDVNDFIEAMSRDKKILDKKLRFITLRGLGSAEITEDPPEDLVLKSINL